MGRHAHSHRRTAGGHGVGQLRPFRQHQCQGAGPEAIGQKGRRRRPGGRDPGGVRGVGDVDDEGVVRRPALGREDARHRGGVESVGAEAVDRLRREGHQPAGAQDRGRASDGVSVGLLRVGWQDFGVHGGNVARPGARSRCFQAPGQVETVDPVQLADPLSGRVLQQGTRHAGMPCPSRAPASSRPAWMPEGDLG